MLSKKHRKLWSSESMKAAVKSVDEGKGLREASRLYNVPVETLRRRVTGKVDIDCRPGLPTILTKDEEDTIVHYLIKMADMGYGLTPDAVLHMLLKNFSDLTHLRMKKRVDHGIGDLGTAILTFQSVSLNLYPIAEHCLPTRT